MTESKSRARWLKIKEKGQDSKNNTITRYVDNNGESYHIREHVYVDMGRPDSPYGIAFILAFKSRKEGLSMDVRWYYRPLDISASVYSSLLSERENADNPIAKTISHREVFASEVLDSCLACYIVGRCYIVSYRNSHQVAEFRPFSDTYFYFLTYSPHIKRLANTASEIRIGPRFQAKIPSHPAKHDDQEETSDQTPREQLLWSGSASEKLSEHDLFTYVQASRSFGAFSGMCEKGNAEELVGFAHQDSVLQTALDKLHSNDYKFEPAIDELSSMSIDPPVLQTWIEDEQKKFQRGIRQLGKNFGRIQRECLPNRTVNEVVEFYYFWKKTSVGTSMRPRRRIKSLIQRRPKNKADLTQNEIEVSVENENTETEFRCVHCGIKGIDGEWLTVSHDTVRSRYCSTCSEHFKRYACLPTENTTMELDESLVTGRLRDVLSPVLRTKQCHDSDDLKEASVGDRTDLGEATCKEIKNERIVEKRESEQDIGSRSLTPPMKVNASPDNCAWPVEQPHSTVVNGDTGSTADPITEPQPLSDCSARPESVASSTAANKPLLTCPQPTNSYCSSAASVVSDTSEQFAINNNNAIIEPATAVTDHSCHRVLWNGIDYNLIRVVARGRNSCSRTDLAFKAKGPRRPRPSDDGPTTSQPADPVKRPSSRRSSALSSGEKKVKCEAIGVGCSSVPTERHVKMNAIATAGYSSMTYPPLPSNVSAAKFYTCSTASPMVSSAATNIFNQYPMLPIPPFQSGSYPGHTHQSITSSACASLNQHHHQQQANHHSLFGADTPALRHLREIAVARATGAMVNGQHGMFGQSHQNGAPSSNQAALAIQQMMSMMGGNALVSNSSPFAGLAQAGSQTPGISHSNTQPLSLMAGGHGYQRGNSNSDTSRGMIVRRSPIQASSNHTNNDGASSSLTHNHAHLHAHSHTHLHLNDPTASNPNQLQSSAVTQTATGLPSTQASSISTCQAGHHPMLMFGGSGSPLIHHTSYYPHIVTPISDDGRGSNEHASAAMMHIANSSGSNGSAHGHMPSSADINTMLPGVSPLSVLLSQSQLAAAAAISSSNSCNNNNGAIPSLGNGGTLTGSSLYHQHPGSMLNQQQHQQAMLMMMRTNPQEYILQYQHMLQQQQQMLLAASASRAAAALAAATASNSNNGRTNAGSNHHSNNNQTSHGADFKDEHEMQQHILLSAALSAAVASGLHHSPSNDSDSSRNSRSTSMGIGGGSISMMGAMMDGGGRNRTSNSNILSNNGRVVPSPSNGRRGSLHTRRGEHPTADMLIASHHHHHHSAVDDR